MWNEISCTKLQLPPETLTRGLLPPDPRSLCLLSSTEFVKLPPSPEQNSWVRHWSIRSYGKVGQMVRKVEIHRQIWTAQQNYWVEDEKGERTKMFPIYGHSQSIQQCVRAPFMTSTVTRDDERVCRGCALTCGLSLCGRTKPKLKSACG